MKFTAMLVAGLFCSANAFADNTAAQRAIVEYVGHSMILQTTAALKADFSAIALHCSKLDKQFAPRFAERRFKLEQDWLENVSKTAWFMKMASEIMVSRPSPGALSSGPSFEPMKKLERLPEVPAAMQETANRKSMDKVAMDMEPLSPEQQRERCEAEFAPKPVPEKSDAKAMPGL